MKAKKNFITLCCFAAIIFSIGAAYAASDFYRLKIADGEIIIDEHGVCKKVIRTNGGEIFIPTKTDTEWAAFRNNATGVALSDCAVGTYGSCSGIPTVTDIDGNVYNTVQVGTQCWMKENIKVTKNPSGGAITRYCYNNDPVICNTDGGLYDWNTAMRGSNTEGLQGICPDGWHIPKDSEWYALESFLWIQGGSTGTCSASREGPLSGWGCDKAGTALKIGGSSGFEGIPAGDRLPDGTYTGRVSLPNPGDGGSAFFLSSTYGTGGYLGGGPVLRNLYYHSTDADASKVLRYYFDMATSVRCIRN